MNLNLKVFLRSLGILMLVMGATMVLPLVVSLIYKETSTALCFITTIIPVSLIGFIIYFGITPAQTRLTVRDGFLIVSVCWILASIVAAIPFMLTGSIPNAFDAFFECASGLSTTGASILTDIEILPKGILFWRSFTHWLGGMGILVFAVALLPSLGIGANIIASAETPGPTMDKVTPKISDAAKSLYQIYTILTLLEMLLLMLAGMDLFDASTHSFASMGTGGFSNYNDSVAHFNSVTIEMIITAFMILAGVNFNLYFHALKNKGGLKNIFVDDEFRLYIGIIAITTIFIGINLWLSSDYENLGESLRFSSFQVASIITTTGFASANFDLWPTFSKMLLFMLMLVGGCSASTGGGIKVIRLLVVLKLIKRGIQVRLHPNAIISIKINDKKLNIDTVSSIANFLFLHIVVVAISTLLVSLDGFDILSSFSAVLACIGNIGPGFNVTGPVMNYSVFSEPVKFLLSLLMLAGRLELYTFIMLVMPNFWQQDRY